VSILREVAIIKSGADLMSTKPQPISKVAIGIAAFAAGLAITLLVAKGATAFIVGQINHWGDRDGDAVWLFALLSS
jgi:hypothetical protein